MIEQTKNLLREIREMFKAFQVFNRWPERSMNICLWDLKRNLTDAMGRLCGFLGPEMCRTDEVVRKIVSSCYVGNCNSYSWSDRRETECRPTRIIGRCNNTEVKLLEKCVWE